MKIIFVSLDTVRADRLGCTHPLPAARSLPHTQHGVDGRRRPVADAATAEPTDLPVVQAQPLRPPRPDPEPAIHRGPLRRRDLVPRLRAGPVSRTPLPT